MRIGFDAKRLFFNPTGLGAYSRTLIRSLLEADPDLEALLYTPSSPVGAWADEFSGERLQRIHPKKWSPAWRSFGVAAAIRRDAPDVFHGLSNEIPFLPTGRPTVVTIHDLIFLILPKTYPAIDRNMYHAKARYACRHADCIIAISESARKDLIRLWSIDPARVEVAYQAVDPAFFSPPPPLDPGLGRYLPNEFLLSVGSIVSRKNLGGVAEAMALMPKSLRPAVAVLGRGTAYQREVQQKIKRLGLTSCFIWLPEVTGTGQLHALYRRSMGLIYPSLYEGFGLPVAEALVSGTPVIASNRAALPEAAGPGALLPDPADPEALAEAITRFVSNQALRGQLAHEGSAYARALFSPAQTARKMLNLYRRIA